MSDSCLRVCHVSSVQGLLLCNIKLIFMTDYTRLDHMEADSEQIEN